MPGLPENMMVPTDTARELSPHVYVIEGFPYIAIVVGTQSTLVVDTGLGPVNGAAAAHTALALAPQNHLYLVNTHYHSEHAARENGFPAATVLIGTRVQQEETDKYSDANLAWFRNAAPALMADVMHLRRADIIFDGTLQMDLGRVTARVFTPGPAHSLGDTLVYVEGDQVLVTGDVVQNKTSPIYTAPDIGPCRWRATLDSLPQSPVRIVVPNHTKPGGPELIVDYRAFLNLVCGQSKELKRQGVVLADAIPRITDAVKTTYPDWALDDDTIAEGVKRACAGQ